jgi:hypothetical protein
LCLSPFALFAWFYATNIEMMAMAGDARRAKLSRLDELCASARIEIRRVAGPARSLLFRQTSSATYRMLEKLEFVEHTWDPRIDQSWPILSAERVRKKPNQPLFVRGEPNVEREAYVKPQAQYEIGRAPIESREDTDLGYFLMETTVLERETREVLAVFRSAGRRRNPESDFCPREFAYGSYDQEVITYVLGLMNDGAAKSFEARLDAMKDRAVRPKR